MIVWVASYPRSGNTFLRILLHRLHGLETSTVYDVDGVAARLGPEFVGYRSADKPLDDLRASDDVFFVKTHRPCDESVEDSDRAICLVRDGRDAIVSWARQRAEKPGVTFDRELRNLVDDPDNTGAGPWGSNVLSWLSSGSSARQLIHYHELIAKPGPTVTSALADLGLDLDLELAIGLEGGAGGRPDSAIPSFAELHAIDPAFFRIGAVGTHRTEMPNNVRARFLADADNRQALERLGYAA